jgi:hypothetical protein
VGVIKISGGYDGDQHHEEDGCYNRKLNQCGTMLATSSGGSLF